MRHDYFVRDRTEDFTFRGRHPAIALLLRITKNLVALVFIATGLAMLVLPGQGILTILIGISVSDFPGKRTLEVALLRLPGIYTAINWIRSKGRKRPLLLPPRKPRVPAPDRKQDG
jgi:hypothetical protein